MSSVKELEPRAVWGFFDEITKIPRPSGDEGRIIDFLENFARKNGLEYRRDHAGNIVIAKPATRGYESLPGVILQSHVDMVAEKEGGVEFDFHTDPIEALIDGAWVRARGTTLGADDGIGMAASMAVLVADDIEHPAVEALFTVAEETGLSGAFGLGSDMLTGKYLINLDSEQEGEIFIGCAGGMDTVATMEYSTEKAPADHTGYKVWVKGLTGGHSGDDIEKGRANSNKLLARILLEGGEKSGLRLALFDGGNLPNAIPREAHAFFMVPDKHKTVVKENFGRVFAEIAEEFRYTESGMKFGLEQADVERVIDPKAQSALLHSLQGAANGVLAMSRTIEGLVETSSNLASVKFTEKGKIVVTASQRSSVESAKHDAARTLESVFTLAGASVTHSDGYPGWEPDPKSKLLHVTEEAYLELFGRRPLVKAIHAGLECGIFLEKYPELDMVSFGPTLSGVHSPDERIEISTVDKFWKLIVEVIKNIKNYS